MNNSLTKNKADNKVMKLMAFIIMPLAFTFFGYFILNMVSSVPFGSVSSYVKLFVLDKPPIFSDKVNNIFKPPANENTNGTVSINSIQLPQYETIYGHIDIESLGISCPLVYGDSVKALKIGAGQFTGSFLPGYGAPILIAGHNNTVFVPLKNIKIGETVKITTSYGTYLYRITRTDTRSDTDRTAYTIKRTDGEILQLYTCKMVNTPIGNVKQRFYAYGEYISGPKIVQ